MRGSGRGNLREASAKNNGARILPHNLPATLSANLPTGWWRRRPERRSSVFAWRSLKRPSPRCGRNWQKSGADGKRPSGSATTYVEKCTPSESRDNTPRRPRSSREGVSPTPMPLALRRAYGGRGEACGVGCWEGSVDERSLQLLKVMREQVGETTGRAVDAEAAAKSLGMYPETLDRSLLYLVRAGYIEEYADRAMSSRNGMFLITLQGIAAIDNA
jgi:hypothetical protein